MDLKQSKKGSQGILGQNMAGGEAMPSGLALCVGVMEVLGLALLLPEEPDSEIDLRGSRLAHLVERVTLDLGVLSLSPRLGVEIT